jgi:hypothetical protein
MIKLFTVKSLINFVPIFLAIALLFASFSKAQTNSMEEGKKESSRFNNQILLVLSNANSSLSELDNNNRTGMSLAIDYNKLKLSKKQFGTMNLKDDDYIPHEAIKHFWLGAGEIAILEFIPWALAKWIRDWEDPADNWANVSKETWWRNLSHGWEYDGDNFTTNNFAHPYHGALFFNAGRTNGYDFWESSAWALTGSAIWEFFGETFRPAFNDWIYTGIGGSNLGEIIYRLSSMVTDNTSSGSERVWGEIFGTLINPVRGFNRAISGEMGKNFPNPKWSKPDDFLISFDAGTRTVDLQGIKEFREKEIQGLFGFDLVYGNKMKARKPFDFFAMRMAISSAEPHFTQLSSTGYLFGWALKKNKHNFGVTLDFTYNNLLRENFSEVDTTSTGFIYGATVIHPYILSVYPVGKKTNLITQIGINGVLMGATPNDYFRDVEGRNYDMGPGVGLRLGAALRNGIWDYLKLAYYGNWFWTQTEPSDSRHHVHWFYLEAQYPLTKYFSFGILAGVYWRNSFYTDLPDQTRPDVYRQHPVLKVFFRTAVIDL